MGDLVWTGGDTHLYSNHMNKRICSLAVNLARCRNWLLNVSLESIFDYRFEDSKLKAESAPGY
ncbi:hypothetical protein ACNKHK_18120 [Shigella flexneri]